MFSKPVINSTGTTNRMPPMVGVPVLTWWLPGWSMRICLPIPLRFRVLISGLPQITAKKKLTAPKARA